MANRWGVNVAFTFQKGVWVVFAKVSFANTGTPTLDTSHSKGVKSVSKASQGDMLITFGTPGGATDSYPAFLFGTGTWDNQFTDWVGTNVTTQIYNQGNIETGSVNMQFINASGALVDPPDTMRLNCVFYLGNSTAY